MSAGGYGVQNEVHFYIPVTPFARNSFKGFFKPLSRGGIAEIYGGITENSVVVEIFHEPQSRYFVGNLFHISELFVGEPVALRLLPTVVYLNIFYRHFRLFKPCGVIEYDIARNIRSVIIPTAPSVRRRFTPSRIKPAVNKSVIIERGLHIFAEHDNRKIAFYNIARIDGVIVERMIDEYFATRRNAYFGKIFIVPRRAHDESFAVFIFYRRAVGREFFFTIAKNHGFGVGLHFVETIPVAFGKPVYNRPFEPAVANARERTEKQGVFNGVYRLISGFIGKAVFDFGKSNGEITARSSKFAAAAAYRPFSAFFFESIIMASVEKDG